MANYMARVELHQAGPEDYERLHASMQQRGYMREMTGEDGAISWALHAKDLRENRAFTGG
jgi:hypothetical protein